VVKNCFLLFPVRMEIICRNQYSTVETENEILRGEIKIYVKDMSGHKFAERGGDVLQICVFMTDIHIIGLKIGLKKHTLVFL
jgi:hypothetical protein